jgi:hypothetical protein
MNRSEIVKCGNLLNRRDLTLKNMLMAHVGLNPDEWGVWGPRPRESNVQDRVVQIEKIIRWSDRQGAS